MKKRENEAVLYLSKFILDKPIYIPEKGTFDYQIIIEALEKIRRFDRPDFFAVVNEKVFLFEHFEIDSSPHSKKGSRNRIEIKKDDDKFSEMFDKFEGENYGKIYNGQLDVRPGSAAYLEHLLSIFEKHYKKIADYKKNILRSLNDDKQRSFVVTFLIEDTSVFGTPYFDGGIKQVLPIFCKEFRDIFIKKTDVDVLICSSETIENEKITWMISRVDIDSVKERETEILKKELINLNPMTLRTRLFVPNKK